MKGNKKKNRYNHSKKKKKKKNHRFMRFGLRSMSTSSYARKIH